VNARTGGALPALVLFVLVRFMPQVAPEISNGDRDRNPLLMQAPSLNWGRSVQQRLFRRRNTRLVLVATSIALFNQLSGVNILLLYMLEILASAGMGFSLGHRYTVLISCLSLVTTFAGIAFVDRLGRKPLLYIGSAGMAVCLLMLALAIPHHLAPLLYVSILVVYNVFFAFSQGTVVWVYLSELFPPGLRGLGQGYGASVHWIANAVLVSIFPSVQHVSTAGIFYLFALMMAFQIVVIRLWYPETKGTALGSFAAAGDAGENRLR
jgi:MFS transporter, SP family, arabinose:H+ symporter